MSNPDSSLSFWLSIFPLTSPVIMMVRIAYGVPAFELILSMLLLILGFFATTWLSAKIYRTGILMYGKKTSYKKKFGNGYSIKHNTKLLMMTVAIIDLGTNTFNLIVVQLHAAQKFTVLYNDKISVKLGEGGIEKNVIQPAAFNRGISAIDKP